MPKGRSGSAKDPKGKAQRRNGSSLKASWAEGNYHAQQGSDESDADESGGVQDIPFRLVTGRHCSTSWQAASAVHVQCYCHITPRHVCAQFVLMHLNQLLVGAPIAEVCRGSAPAGACRHLLQHMEQPCCMSMCACRRCGIWGTATKNAATGTRLMRLNVVSEMRLGTPFPGVILSPNGKSCVSMEDQDLIAAKGMAVVDCSWNRLEEVPFSETLHFCSVVLVLSSSRARPGCPAGRSKVSRRSW